MSRSGPYRDATLGLLRRVAASLAINTLQDIRAQRWMALRLPAACGYLEKRTLAPDGDPLDPLKMNWRPDHTSHIGHPVYTEALARSEASDRRALAAHRRGEVVLYFFSSQLPPTFEVIVAWLSGITEHDPDFLDRLSRVTWPQAEVRAKRWLRNSAKGGQHDERQS